MMIILHFRKIPLSGVVPVGSGETLREPLQPSWRAGGGGPDGGSRSGPKGSNYKTRQGPKSMGLITRVWERQSIVGDQQGSR